MLLRGKYIFLLCLHAMPVNLKIAEVMEFILLSSPALNSFSFWYRGRSLNIDKL